MYSDIEEFEGWEYRYNYTKRCVERVTKITDDWHDDAARLSWSEDEVDENGYMVIDKFKMSNKTWQDEEKKQKCLKAFSILFSESVDAIREGVAVC